MWRSLLFLSFLGLLTACGPSSSRQGEVPASGGQGAESQVVAGTDAGGDEAETETTRSKQALIEELVKITQLEPMLANIGEGLSGQLRMELKRRNPNLSEEALQVIEEETAATLRESAPLLVREIVPIYDELFTEAEIRAMLAFYRSEEGASIIAKMPAVMARAFPFGQRWGEALTATVQRRVLARLRAQGHRI